MKTYCFHFLNESKISVILPERELHTWTCINESIHHSHFSLLVANCWHFVSFNLILEWIDNWWISYSISYWIISSLQTFHSTLVIMSHCWLTNVDMCSVDVWQCFWLLMDSLYTVMQAESTTDKLKQTDHAYNYICVMDSCIAQMFKQAANVRRAEELLQWSQVRIPACKPLLHVSLCSLLYVNNGHESHKYLCGHVHRRRNTAPDF